MTTRRDFLGTTAGVSAALAKAAAAAGNSEPPGGSTEAVSLCGPWKFQLDPENAGGSERWFAPGHSVADWHDVAVPHTWQVDPRWTDYRGVAWYRRAFDAPAAWRGAVVRVEFEAVFHSAAVWVNGQPVGEHLRKGYTSFALNITPAFRWDGPNTIVVRVDSAFNDQMVPRGRSSDWANDGGIYRPVDLLVTPQTFIERVEVDAEPDLNRGDAALSVRLQCTNAGAKPWSGVASFRVIDEETGLAVAISASPASFAIEAGASRVLNLKGSLAEARLWHFDWPHLYRLECSIAGDGHSHTLETTFGVRKFEVKDGRFHLNGEPVRLMGVERMAGSNPAFGMAEPAEWIEHDHRDLKDLNCVFTRVHWPQDRRVLDDCDRHGILVQTEVPAWGPDTFKGVGAQPDPAILENGLDQLREMIARDRNHPSVVVWGLCNEIGGQAPAAYEFARRMLEEAKRLDPARLCSYASHSLRNTPGRDVAGLMDIIETNEYFGSWQAGTAEDAARHLDDLHAAFPGKPVVVSEYGYCACTVDRPEGDEHRIAVLVTHDAAIRSRDFVSGAIFFCYNDYRTHVGDRGTGALQQRVHGVVDLFGARKPSYAVLQRESSPVESLTIANRSNQFHLVLKTRGTLPAYTLRGYKLRGVLYAQGDIPVESKEAEIPDLAPEKNAELELRFVHPETPLYVRFEILRPAGFPVCSVDWKS
jgi:beta-glucuronidase